MFCLQKLYLECFTTKISGAKRHSICLCYPEFHGNRPDQRPRLQMPKKPVHQHQNKRKSSIKVVAKALLSIPNFKCYSKSPFLYIKNILNMKI